MPSLRVAFRQTSVVSPFSTQAHAELAKALSSSNKDFEMDDDFYRSQARIAHNMLHLAFAKLDNAKRKEIQLRAEPLLEKVAQRQGADEDEQGALELIRASLRQILRNEVQATSGDVETLDMAKSALNIFACIARV